MDGSCDSPRNPLVRDGTSQTQRLLEALKPSYVNIDDRSVLDLLSYAKNVARDIQYYNRENNPDGDWLPFIENDVSIIIAEIARKDLEPRQHCMDNLLAQLETLHSSDSQQARAALARIFDILHLLAAEMNTWFGNAVEGFRLHEELDRFISGELGEELRHSLRYYKHAVNENLLTEMPEVDRLCEPLAFPDELFTQTRFDSRWIPADFPGPRSWGRYLESLEPDDSVFTGSNTVERIIAASDRLHRSYRMFRDAQRRMIHSAPDYLQEILEEWPRHDPHMGLFLTFLQLFRNARDHLNGLTRHHLDFYYKRVLRLDRRGPVPDTVHVIFSLAKQVNEHFLEEGTELSAGKDTAGKDVIYQLDQELEVNKAAVDQVKSVFIEKRDEAGEEKHIIHAAPVADSSDGRGGKFSSAEPKWQTFGSADPSTTVLPDVGFALASPVLLLQEGDREITISITCGSSTADLDLKPAYFQVYSSGQKKWNKVKVTNVETTGVSIKFTLMLGPEDPPVVWYNAEALKGTFATDYMVSKGAFGTGSPVIMLLLRTQSEKTTDAYSQLKDRQVQRINVSVNVGGISDEFLEQSGQSKTGVKSVILQNDQGMLDPSKAFFPFGNNPGLQSNFYVGSTEIFSKDLTALNMRVHWKDVPTASLEDHYRNLAFYRITDDTITQFYQLVRNPPNQSVENILTEVSPETGQPRADEIGKTLNNSKNVFLSRIELENRIPAEVAGELTQWMDKLNNTVFQARCYLRQDGVWKKLTDKALFDESDATQPNILTFRDEESLKQFTARPIEEDLTEYTVSVKRGFFRMALVSPDFAFGHAKYREGYAKAAMEHAQGNLDIEELPKPPYTPQISALELSYSAEDSINFASDGEEEEPTVRLFHLYPFGHQQLSSDQEPFLVPQFSYESAEPAVEMDNEGELYIGLKDLEPPQSVSLLFQMAEGTADPTIIDHDVYWSYLSENAWVPLQTDQILRDSTDQLVTSGIVHLFLPEEATNDNTLLPSNLHWIRASMGEHTAAVCDTIAVMAQVAEASFADRGNDPDFLAEDLAAGSITGLRNSRSEIKSVTQPYASFDGRVQEQPEQYYTRVSERLRHRQRGVTIWDYERLVLERFPSVYKAKCINHSTYDYHRDSLNISRSEFAPGFVTLVIIPNLWKKNAVNPLQPRASLRLLREIEEYLQEIMPAFAARRIRVINPRYERIQVEFSMTFHTGYDRGHYLDQLKQDITQFLSPWAFRTGEDIMFGGRIHRSNILHFIEKREYVDYVNNFRMHQYPSAEGTEDKLVDIEEAQPQTARSILVSHENHTITD